MINDIKLDDDAIDSLGLWWLERPTVIFSKFITTAVHKQHKLHDMCIYIYIYASNYPTKIYICLTYSQKNNNF